MAVSPAHHPPAAPPNANATANATATATANPGADAGDSRPARFVIAIDIGGTKIAAGVVTEGGRILADGRIPTRGGEGADLAVPRLCDLCRELVGQAGVSWRDALAVGVASPGPLDPAAGVIQNPSNLPGWVNVPIVQALRDAFAVDVERAGRPDEKEDAHRASPALPVFLDNDANAAAIGEHRFGAGRGVSHLLYLTISTGIGGGIVIHDRLYQGANGNAGELGHMSIAFDGRPCPCGLRGCIEAYASGPAIAARAREAIVAGANSSLATARQAADRPESITPETVVAAVRAGDPFAVELWDQTMRLLGLALANFIHIFNPRRIIIGGGVSQVGDLLFEPLRRHTFALAMKPIAQACEIVPAELGGLVGILGAAAVALDGLAAKT